MLAECPLSHRAPSQSSFDAGGTCTRVASPEPTPPASPACDRSPAPADGGTKRAAAPLSKEVGQDERDALRADVARLRAALAASEMKCAALTRRAFAAEHEAALLRMRRPATVTVPRFWRHRQGFVVFEVRVDRGAEHGPPHAVFHRYSDFRDLHDKAKKACPNVALPSLPGRGGLLVAHTGNDAARLEARRQELDVYMRQFVAVEALREIPHFEAFVAPAAAAPAQRRGCELRPRAALVPASATAPCAPVPSCAADDENSEPLIMMSMGDLDAAFAALTSRR